VVRIRMQRMGRHNKPFYRINAVEKRVRRDGKVLENLGWYNPLAGDEAKQLSLNEDRLKHWLSVGAQPSDTVRDFLAKRKLIPTQEWEAERARRRQIIETRKAAAPAEAAPAAAKA
jgi:small subunit ribosomal protein S16